MQWISETEPTYFGALTLSIVSLRHHGDEMAQAIRIISQHQGSL